MGPARRQACRRDAGLRAVERVARNTRGAGIAVTLTRRPAWHLRAGRVSGGPPPTWPASGWRVRLTASGPASQAGPVAPIPKWIRTVASPVRYVPDEDCVLAGRCGFGGLRTHWCGAFSFVAADPPPSGSAAEGWQAR